MCTCLEETISLLFLQGLIVFSLSSWDTLERSVLVSVKSNSLITFQTVFEAVYNSLLIDFRTGSGIWSILRIPCGDINVLMEFPWLTYVQCNK